MRTRKPQIRSYAQAAAYLGRKLARPLPGRNTLIRRTWYGDDPHGAIEIVYHQTGVVAYRPDGQRIDLDTGGYNSVTTRARIRQYSPARPYTRDYEQLLDLELDVPYPRRRGQPPTASRLFYRTATIDAATGAPIVIDGQRIPGWRRHAEALRAQMATWEADAARWRAEMAAGDEQV